MFHFDFVDPTQMGTNPETRKLEREAATKRFIPGSATFEIRKILTHDRTGQTLTTKSGDPKIVIILEMEDTEFNKAEILMHITKKMGFRIHGLCMAIGRPDLYTDSGLDTGKIVGYKGRCLVEGKTDDYGYKLDITKFVDPKVAAENNMSFEEVIKNTTGAAFQDDEIPF